MDQDEQQNTVFFRSVVILLLIGIIILLGAIYKKDMSVRIVMTCTPTECTIEQVP